MPQVEKPRLLTSVIAVAFVFAGHSAAQSNGKGRNGALDTCSRLTAELPSQPPVTDNLDAAGTCKNETCYALASIDAAIEHVEAVIKGATDNSEKDLTEIKTAIVEIKKHRESISKRLVSLKPDLKPLPPADTMKPWNNLLLAKAACELISKAIKERMTASIAARTEAEKLKVCQAKQDRLADFLLRYYGLSSSPAPGSNRLEVVQARYGDLYNEDREYHRAKARELGSAEGQRYLESQRHRVIDTATPRAGLRFTDPENRAVDVDWARHRHTCDITAYMRRHCGATSRTGDAATSAGPDYCFLTTTAATGSEICGFDPSPQGDKQYHVQFTCNGVAREAKFPDKTKRITLMCAQPPSEVTESEKEFFRSEPCAVTLPAVSAPDPAPAAPATPEKQPAPKSKG